MSDFLLLGLAGLCLWGLRPVKPFGKELNREALSPQTTTSLRGAMALLVIFVHVAQMNPAGPVFAVVGKMGNMAVSVFFFLSGYGLQKQHMTREDYRKGFLRKRILFVALPYVVVTSLYWLYYRWLGMGYRLQYVLQRLVSGNPLASFSWFILAIMGFYFAFWLMMLLCGKNHKAMLRCGVCWFVLHTALCLLLKYDFWWYVSSFSAVAGMFWAVNEEKLQSLLAKRYFLVAAGTLVALVLFLLLDKLCGVPYLNTALKAVAVVLFALLLAVLLHKFRFGNPVLYYLGQMSMELYLLHGMGMMLIRNPVIYIADPLLYCALVVPVTVLLASIVHIAFKGLPKKNPTL